MNIAVVHSFHCCCCWSTNALWWLHTWLVYCEWIEYIPPSAHSYLLQCTIREHITLQNILFNIQLVVLYERVVSRICSIWMILLTNPWVTIICIYVCIFFFYFMYADWLQIMCWSDEKPQAICLNTASHRICSLFDMYYTCTVRVVTYHMWVNCFFHITVMMNVSRIIRMVVSSATAQRRWRWQRVLCCCSTMWIDGFVVPSGYR